MCVGCLVLLFGRAFMVGLCLFCMFSSGVVVMMSCSLVFDCCCYMVYAPWSLYSLLLELRVSRFPFVGRVCVCVCVGCVGGGELLLVVLSRCCIQFILCLD